MALPKGFLQAEVEVVPEVKETKPSKPWEEQSFAMFCNVLHAFTYITWSYNVLYYGFSGCLEAFGFRKRILLRHGWEETKQAADKAFKDKVGD